MQDLKQTLLTSPGLWPIDYTSTAPVILSANTSHIAVRYILSQCNLENIKLWYYTQFGFITLNKTECQFSQLKLKLYSLYRALWLLKLYLIGVWNLVIKVDARYIKEMLQNSDISPLASMKHWIVILMFQFTLVHVPGTHHMPDGLSRQKPQPGDEEEPKDNFEDWINDINGFLHYLNLHLTSIHSLISTPPIALCI